MSGTGIAVSLKEVHCMSEGKIAFVFSGQGAQCPGMGKALCETSKAAAAVFALADRIRPGTSQQCFHGTKEELNLTINTQPCLFSVDLAAARAVEELGIRADLTAGFSLGEIAALAFSGALEDESAFRLVCKRAEFMQEAAERNPGAMGAALGIDAEKLSKVLARFENAQAVNFNCPGQIVFAAKESDIDEIAAAVQENGGKFRRLAVSGAFHSRFMEDASRKMLEYLKNVSVRPASVPVYANRTAEPYGETEQEMKSLIAEQICSAVQWQSTIERMIRDGASVFIETGEGKVLSGLIRKINKSVKVLHYSEVLANGGSL